MPIYEYRCAGCGEHFERLQSFAGATAPLCPRCGATEVTKLISLIGGLASSGQAGMPMSTSGCGCGGACSCGR